MTRPSIHIHVSDVNAMDDVRTIVQERFPDFSVYITRLLHDQWGEGYLVTCMESVHHLVCRAVETAIHGRSEIVSGTLCQVGPEIPWPNDPDAVDESLLVVHGKRRR